MAWINYLPLGLYVLNFVAFAWGATFFFAKPKPVRFGFRLVQVLSIGVWVVQSYGLAPSPEHELGLIVVSSIVLVASGALFVWTLWETRQRRLSLIYSSDVPGFLNRVGPYRFVRHPFYTSYMFCYLGAAIAAWNVPSLVAFLAITGVYIHASQVEEAKFQRSPFAAEYQAYRREVSGFIPFIF